MAFGYQRTPEEAGLEAFGLSQTACKSSQNFGILSPHFLGRHKS
jgi:hypothetical protein